MQLEFVGIQHREELIVQAKKYIVKYTLAKVVLMKANFVKARVEQFMHAFKNLIDNGFPIFLEQGRSYDCRRWLSLFVAAERNDITSIEQLDPIIKGSDIYDVLNREF